MGEFQGEQSQITAVEQKAAKLDDKGKKTHEQLASELKAKHDVFFKQVDDTSKVFKNADKLKNEASKTEMGKDKQEIKNLLVQAATSGETILSNKEANPDFVTIRQSADRITKLSTTVGENLAFFQDMDKAKESLGYAQDSLKDMKKYEPEPGMAMREFAQIPGKPTWHDDYKNLMASGIENLGEFGVKGFLDKHPTAATAEMKAIFDKIKEDSDAAMRQITESRMRFFENFTDKWNTYMDDKGKEVEMTQEQRDAVKKLQAIRKGSEGGAEKGGYDGYNLMITMTSNGKFQLEQAKTAKDDKEKQRCIDDAKDCFTQAKTNAASVGPELAKIDSKNLPGEFLTIYNVMNGNTASSLKDATDGLDKIEKGSPVDSKAAIEAAEKEYSDGDKSPKKSYENAIAARDKVMAAKDLNLDDKDLKDSTEAGLNGLCALRGKLAAIDRSTIPRELQPRFDTLASNVDSNMRELAQVKIMLMNKSVIDDMDKNGLKYFRILKKSVNGQDVVVIEQTDEFKKLPPDKQKLAMDQFVAVQASVMLDLTRKMDLKEDKDWNEGMGKFEKGDWQGAKKQLLDYFMKNKDNPEKSLQIGSATGLLQQIVKMEFQEAKANLVLMKQVEDSGQDLTNINHQELGVSRLMAWRKMDEAEKIVNSGKYLNIKDIWAKVGAPGGKDLVEGIQVGGTDYGITTTGGIIVDKVSFMNPKEISALISEPNPEIRKRNILKIARAAQAAGMTPFAKKYFEMYFADEINEKKKTVTRDQVESAFNKDPDNNKKIQQGIKDAWEQSKTTFYTERNRRLNLNGTGFQSKEVLDAEAKDFKAFEDEYNAKSGNIEDRVRNGIIDDLWTQAAKKALHSDFKNSKTVDLESGGLVKNAQNNIWNEAYGGNLGVAENITGDTLVFTGYDMRDTAAKIAVSILYLEIAAAAGALTGGMASAAILGGAAEVGAGTMVASQVAGFVVEGAVMHTVSVGLNEGAEGFKDPKAFFKGLATTYATLGIMKGVGAGLGKLGGKAGQTIAEGSGEFITPFSKQLGQGALNVVKGGAALTGKSVLDSALMTGLTYGTTKLFEGRTMTADELKKSFGENFVTFMVMGATHKVAEIGQGKGEAGAAPMEQTKEAKATRDAITKSLDADTLAKDARTKANEAAKSGSPDAAKLEANAVKLEQAAKVAEGNLLQKQATERVAQIFRYQQSIEAIKAKLENKNLTAEQKTSLETELAQQKGAMDKVQQEMEKATVDGISFSGIKDQVKTEFKLQQEARDGMAETAKDYNDFKQLLDKKDPKALEAQKKFQDAVAKGDKDAMAKIKAENPQWGKAFDNIENQAKFVETQKQIASLQISDGIQSKSKSATPEEFEAYLETLTKAAKTPAEIDVLDRAIVHSFNGTVSEGKLMSAIENGKMIAGPKLVDLFIEDGAIRVANNPKLKLTGEQQAKIFKKMTTFGDRDYYLDEANKLVESGRIDPSNPEVINALLKSDAHVDLARKLIAEGKAPITREIFKDVIGEKSESALEAVENGIKNGTMKLEPGMTKAEVLKQIQMAKEAMADSKLLRSFRDPNNPQKIEEFKQLMKEATARLRNNEPVQGEVVNLLRRLKERDPDAYKLVLNSDTDRLINTECLDSVVSGDKVQFVDDNGQKVTAYNGKFISKGGMGSVYHTAYAVEGAKNLDFAVIKKPHPNEVDPTTGRVTDYGKYFKDEVAAAREIQKWDNPNIIKPLFVADGIIIYETGEKAADLSKVGGRVSAQEYLQALAETADGILLYQSKGKFHGDLKEANVLRIKVGVDANGQDIWQVKIIDNSPVGYDRSSVPDWPRTPSYSFEIPEMTASIKALHERGMQQPEIDAWMGRAQDARAYGRMLEKAFSHYMPEWQNNPKLKGIVDKLKSPLHAGEPGLIQEAKGVVAEVAVQFKPDTVVPPPVSGTIKINVGQGASSQADTGVLGSVTPLQGSVTPIQLGSSALAGPDTAKISGVKTVNVGGNKPVSGPKTSVMSDAPTLDQKTKGKSQAPTKKAGNQ